MFQSRVNEIIKRGLNAKDEVEARDNNPGREAMSGGRGIKELGKRRSGGGWQDISEGRRKRRRKRRRKGMKMDGIHTGYGDAFNPG